MVRRITLICYLLDEKVLVPIYVLTVWEKFVSNILIEVIVKFAILPDYENLNKIIIKWGFSQKVWIDFPKKKIVTFYHLKKDRMMKNKKLIGENVNCIFKIVPV